LRNFRKNAEKLDGAARLDPSRYVEVRIAHGAGDVRDIDVRSHGS